MEGPLSHNFVITCEHATNRVPDEYRHLFADAGNELHSHRGWDPGAIVVAHTIQRTVHAPIVTFPFTRLLIEPNRSLHHYRLFSEFSKKLSKREKEAVIKNFYLPYRDTVEETLSAVIARSQQVIHLSIHTFTPTLNGSDRAFDVGLLYDPSKITEKKFCLKWRQSLQHISSGFRVKMNQPYKGKSDGFTTYLRRQLGDQYLGIELEVNQQHYFDSSQHWRSISRVISDSLLYMHKTQ